MITEDIAKLTVEIENSADNKELLNHLGLLKQKTAELKNENERLEAAMAILRAQGKDNTDEFNKLRDTLAANKKTVSENEVQMRTLKAALGDTYQSAEQLEKKAKALQRELKGMVREANPEHYDKLKNQLDQVNMQLGRVGRGAEQTGNVFKSITGVASKFMPALGLTAGIGLVAKFGASVASTFKSIQATGDGWAVTVAGFSAGWDYFKRSLVTGDFSNFFTNMNKAIKAGERYAQIMDDLGDRMRSYQLAESENNQTIAELEIQLKNVNLSNEERIDTANKIIALEDNLHKKRVDMATDELQAITDVVAANTNMSEEELKSFIRQYDENKKLNEQAQAYFDLIKEKRKYENMPYEGTVHPFQHVIDAMADEIAATDQSVKTYAAIYKKYQKSTDDELDKMVQSWVKLNNATTDYYRNIATAEVRKNKLIKGDNDNGENEAAKKERLRKEAMQKEINNLENLYKQQQSIIARQKTDDINNKVTKSEVQANFNAKMQAAEIAYLNAKLIALKKYGEATGEVELKLAQSRLKIMEDMQKAAEKAAEKGKETQKNLQNYFDKTSTDFVKTAFTEIKESGNEVDKLVNDTSDDYNKERLDMFDQWMQLRNDYNMVGLNEQFDAEMANLDRLREAGIISTEEAEAAKLKIKLKYASQIAATANQFAQMGAGVVAAWQDYETQKLEAEYEKRLALAGDDADAREQIENEKAQKELELKKKFADFQFAVDVAQIISSTSLAIMQAYAQLGPIAGSIAAALVGSTGLLQIAAAKKQRDAVKSMTLAGGGGSTSQRVVLPGKEQGGYIKVERQQDGKQFRARRRPDARGFVDEPTVLVAENGSEFVANAAAVGNPTVNPILKIIDQAQQQGTIGSLNLPAVIADAYRVKGKVSGGYVNESAASSPFTDANFKNNTELTNVLEEMKLLLTDLKTNGVKAPIVLSEWEKAQALKQRSEELGKR